MIFEDDWKDCLAAFLLGAAVAILCVWIWYNYKSLEPFTHGQSQDAAVCAKLFPNDPDWSACMRTSDSLRALKALPSDASLTDQVREATNVAYMISDISPEGIGAAMTKSGTTCLSPETIRAADVTIATMPKVTSWSAEVRKQVKAC